MIPAFATSIEKHETFASHCFDPIVSYHDEHITNISNNKYSKKTLLIDNLKARGAFTAIALVSVVEATGSLALIMLTSIGALFANRIDRKGLNKISFHGKRLLVFHGFLFSSGVAGSLYHPIKGLDLVERAVRINTEYENLTY
jgi:hypothetical protein